MVASSFKIRIAAAIGTVDAAAWDACANPSDICITDDPLHQERHNPFISHAFLHALEASGSATPRTGWAPAHVLVEDEAGELVAAAPAYAKSHSMGEYVFDHAWAQAYERAGGDYYPKIQVAVPFTPVTGRRLLVKPASTPQETALRQKALITGLMGLREGMEASSLHVTFAPHQEWEALGEAGFLLRTGQQFHFLNKGYRTFDDFLCELSSRKRKMIKRERVQALCNGITIEPLTGAAITQEHWDAFYAFYLETGARKWGQPYLNRAFFSLLGESLAGRILLVMARREGRLIAGAINLIGDDALYGRNWGCIEDHPFLHFEVCYYAAIDFALARGLKRVEAGAQGEHKLARGYQPVETYSAHAIADPRLARAVASYLEAERQQVSETIDAYGDYLPFRKGVEPSKEQVEQD